VIRRRDRAFAWENELELAALWMRHLGSRGGSDVRRTGRRFGAGYPRRPDPDRPSAQAIAKAPPDGYTIGLIQLGNSQSIRTYTRR